MSTYRYVPCYARLSGSLCNTIPGYLYTFVIYFIRCVLLTCYLVQCIISVISLTIRPRYSSFFPFFSFFPPFVFFPLRNDKAISTCNLGKNEQGRKEQILRRCRANLFLEISSTVIREWRNCWCYVRRFFFFYIEQPLYKQCVFRGFHSFRDISQ